jgi:hypothetical protein
VAFDFLREVVKGKTNQSQGCEKSFGSYKKKKKSYWRKAL